MSSAQTAAPNQRRPNGGVQTAAPHWKTSSYPEKLLRDFRSPTMNMVSTRERVINMCREEMKIGISTIMRRSITQSRGCTFRDQGSPETFRHYGTEEFKGGPQNAPHYAERRQLLIVRWRELQWAVYQIPNQIPNRAQQEKSAEKNGKFWPRKKGIYPFKHLEWVLINEYSIN